MTDPIPFPRMLKNTEELAALIRVCQR